MPRHHPIGHDPRGQDPIGRDPAAPRRALPAPVEAEIRRRQRARAIVTALILGGLVILFYAISIAKMIK